MFTPDSPAVTPMDTDGASRAGSASSPDRPYEGTPTPSSVTLDDPDVRLAAEALGDLRADFVSSPPSLPPMFPPAPPYGARSRQSSRPRSPKPEPLLALLTTSHPLVASTIGGASSVYGGAKNYSPRFKSGAEYVEGYLTPLANTVNSVGRATGVEGGVRWFLGGRSRRRATGPTSDPAQEGSGAAKRRRTGPGGEAIDSPEMSAYDDSIAFALPRTPRRLSSASTLDSLPAYDDMRSPAYTEVAAPTHHSKPHMKQHQRWPTRLITSTSGLSIAMSAESLRSLKYCLRWLRWANDHLNHVILMLKHALEEYEKAPEKAHSDDDERNGTSDGSDSSDGNGHGHGNRSDDGREGMDVHQDSGRERETKAPRQSRTEIAARINSLKHDVLKTLQDVVNNVSKYAGGALPENARDLVRRHLTSLPKRFLLATQSDAADKKNSGAGEREPALEEGAQKMLVLAKEGLDIVAQVSGVLDGTIVSAEQWCDSLGRKRQSDDDDDDDKKDFDGREPQDVKMG
ncbi:Clock-controlled protein 8 [Escovopsis weberi]|uniref:Clock-controlled protein 8 n=1 Tax=Escovopsis weberi TaxID=150374 RepID=A0A0M9VRV3_ESCWE|nr:Clock-controlled protein 8 [Escovopsis weberi]